jgi:hypothetical protein
MSTYIGNWIFLNASLYGWVSTNKLKLSQGIFYTAYIEACIFDQDCNMYSQYLKYQRQWNLFMVFPLHREDKERWLDKNYVGKHFGNIFVFFNR